MPVPIPSIQLIETPAQLVDKYIILARIKTSGGVQKGGMTLFESYSMPKAMEAFSVLCGAYRNRIINPHRYSLEVRKVLINKDTPYNYLEEEVLAVMRNGTIIGYC